MAKRDRVHVSSSHASCGSSGHTSHFPDVDCAVLLSKYSAQLVKYDYGYDKADNIEVLSYARCVVDPALYIITRLWLEGYGLGGTKDFCECA